MPKSKNTAESSRRPKKVHGSSGVHEGLRAFIPILSVNSKIPTFWSSPRPPRRFRRLVGACCVYACWQGLLVCLLARLGRMPSVNSYPRDIRNAGRSACMLVRTLACMFPGTVCLYACWHGLLVCLLARSACMLAGTVGAHACVMYDPATLTWRYGLLVCLLAR